MKALSITLRGIAVAGLVGSGLVLTAPAASAQNCSNVPGYAKRVSSGITEYYEDGRCGVDLNRQVTPPAPRPQTPAPPATGCRQYPDGELCGAGIGGPRPPMSHDTWRRLYGSPPPVTSVRVGAPVSIGGGGGGGSVGTVTVGPISNPDKVKKSDSTK
ncbi:hypothetical protein [Aeromicrobium piscarium]|uniref:Uncharacterized protein n=1 Tax=Aeromicrobium piscarium TaxID=2590901 RepID=A0A554SDI2_9ACTN|nr:hypothetical protein [Aeromicrobium piscarium]TSD64410.1 hypothetical protein FNM00_07705 [Aeromicrobium piscarium]